MSNAKGLELAGIEIRAVKGTTDLSAVMTVHQVPKFAMGAAMEGKNLTLKWPATK